MDCPDAEELEALALGAAEPQRPALRAHAASCPACREHLDEVRELEQALASALGAAAGDLRSQRERLMASLTAGSAGSPRRRKAPLALVAVYAAAALMMVVAWLGYAVVYKVQERDALAWGARVDVRNLGLALRRWSLEHEGRLPEGGNRGLVAALSAPRAGSQGNAPAYEIPVRWIRDGAVTDPFGNALVYRTESGAAVLYSVGPDGEDDGGVEDDIAFALP
jgi:anti-sigma factor RsiW